MYMFMKKRIDSAGRIVIPKFIIKELDVKADDTFIIRYSKSEKTIILKKLKEVNVLYVEIVKLI